MAAKYSYVLYKKMALFLFVSFILFGSIALVSASHSTSLSVDKPNGYYISGKDAVTFTIKNTGQDTAYISCGGVKVWQQLHGQQNLVAQETNSCYVLDVSDTSYDMQSWLGSPN